MRTAALFASAALMVAACSRGEEAAKTDSPAAAPAAAPAPAALSLASLAGKWNQTVKAEGSDSVLVRSEVNAGADANSWTITLPNRPAMPMKITVDGDSIMASTGPYESVLRKGVQVTTQGVLRLVDGKLVGTTIARYSPAGADSVVKLRTEMTRAQ
jgi:hypothetical protein